MVIDHNNAFDPDFNAGKFFESHVFRGQFASVFEDCIERLTYIDRMKAAISAFDIACNNSPQEWWWIDHEVPCGFNKDAARRLLERFVDQSFWGAMS